MPGGNLAALLSDAEGAGLRVSRVLSIGTSVCEVLAATTDERSRSGGSWRPSLQQQSTPRGVVSKEAVGSRATRFNTSSTRRAEARRRGVRDGRGQGSSRHDG